MVSDQGIGPTKERVLAHLNATKPKTVPEVRSFLGLVNFSARYIPNLSTLCEPLRRLTKKGVKFEWRSEQDQCFSKLKECLAKSSTLGPFRLDAKKTLLVTDASNVGLGSVLIQQDDKGNVKIICYASRSLTDVEKRYSTLEKEVIAVVWGCEKFRLYLLGVDFELVTTSHYKLYMAQSLNQMLELSVGLQDLCHISSK